MKLVATTAVLILLSGCAAVDAFLMKYDPNEYQQIADIRTTAYLSKGSCDSPAQAKLQAETLANKTLTFKQFVQYLPRNDKVIAASVDLDKIAQGLKDQYTKSDKVSPAFCKIKFQSVETSAESMQKIIGDKPK
jgi:hypothetical protein